MSSTEPELPDDAPYESIVEALESVTARMSSESIGIEEATDLYERAARLHALAADRLAKVQERIDRLGGTTPSGAC